MQHRHYLTAMLVLVFMLPVTASAQSFFTAKFSAAQQTHDVSAEGTGTAVMLLDEEGLRFILSVEGLTGDIAAAHFHNGAAGTDGGVVRTITDDFDGGTAIGTWTGADAEPLTDELIADLFAGRLYLNVHTPDNQPGELRAQIYPSSGTGLMAALTSAQETHEVTSDAAGTAALQVTDAGVAYFITVEGLSGDIAAAHFHNAAAGDDGGVLRTITFSGNSAVGIWTASDTEPLTDDAVVSLMTGQVYVNVHTPDNQPGEIRGQIIPTGGWGFSAKLDAGQQTGDVTSNGMGTASLTLTDGGLIYHITADSLSGDIAAAHFHNAPAGMDGGVVRTIEFNGNTAAGIWRPGDAEPLTGDLIQEIIAGNIYINLHTMANQAGEIRGQVMQNPGTSLASNLTAAQENHEVTSDATGTATLNLTPDGVAFDLTISGLSGDIAAAHFHNGAAGEDGGVVRTITDDFTGTTASGLWTASDTEALTPELMAELLTGNLYFNVHTAANQPGEIRGQIYISGGTSLIAYLSNEQQTSEVTQDASGTAVMTLTSKGLVFNISTEGLSGDIVAAHFHNGAAGTDGGVARTIDEFVAGSAEGLWSGDNSEVLTDSLRNELLAGNMYINIHTMANQPGEIRGQVRLAGGIGSAVHLSPDQETHDVTSDGQGAASITLTNAGAIFDLTAEGLSGDITAGHFHNAMLGADGPVARGISDDISGNTGFGVWRASDAEALTADFINAMLAGNLYLNLHTMANQPGEIRGQVNPGSIVVTSIDQIDAETPETFVLSQNYPNPFNPSTTIEFSVSRAVDANLSIFNVLGQRVATLVENRVAVGTYQVTFEAQNLPSGLYYYRLDAGDASLTKSMLLLK